MANKRRAKKYKVPYKRYGPNGIISTKISANDVKESSSGYYGYESSGSVSRNGKRDDDERLFYTFTYGNVKSPKDQDYYGDIKKETNQQLDEISINSEEGPVFPPEVFENILQRLAEPEGLNLKLFLVCKMFYKFCLKILYERPVLNSRNFNKFVMSMTTPSIVSYINFELTGKFFNEQELEKSSLAYIKRHLKYSKTPLVKSLDLTNIIQAGKNSNITKILRRCSANLTEIVAPQSSFGITSLSILKMCHNLVVLDLSLVSETVNLNDLFHSIKELDHLKCLRFPRSSINCNLDNHDIFRDLGEHERSFKWPKNLQHLRLSGGVTNEFLMDLNFPNTLTTLEFQHCTLVHDYSIYYLLSKIGLNLKKLSILYPMPSLKENSLDLIFKYCPFLTHIETFVDYISQWCFCEVNFPWIVNAKYLPDFGRNTRKENILLGGKKDRKSLKYDFSFDDQEECPDMIIATTEDFFGQDLSDDEFSDSISSTSTSTNNLTNNLNNSTPSITNNPNNSNLNNSTTSVTDNSPKHPQLKSLRPLRSMYLGSSGTLGQANKIHPDDLIIAIGESRLPNLKTLQVSNRVGWNQGDDTMMQLVDLFAESNNGTIYMCP